MLTVVWVKTSFVSSRWYIFIFILGKTDSYPRWSDINTNTYPHCAVRGELGQILISLQNSPWLSKLGPCLGSYQGTFVQAVTSSWDKVVEHQHIFKQTCNVLVFQLAGIEGKPEVVLDMTWLPIYPLLHAEVTVCEQWTRAWASTADHHLVYHYKATLVSSSNKFCLMQSEIPRERHVPPSADFTATTFGGG